MGFDCDAARARLGSTPLDDGSILQGLRPLFGPRFRWADSAPVPGSLLADGSGWAPRGASRSAERGRFQRRRWRPSFSRGLRGPRVRVNGGSVLCGVPPLARRLAAAPSPPLRPAQVWTLAFSRSASGIRPGRPRSSRASAIVNAIGMGERFDSIAWRHEMCRNRGGRERRPRGAPGMAIYLLAARRRSDRRRVP